MEKYGVCVKCSGSGHYMEKNASGDKVRKDCSVCHSSGKNQDIKLKIDKDKKND